MPELEERYREWLPVIELDGGRLSVYRVEEDAFEPSAGRLADGVSKPFGHNGRDVGSTR